MIALLTIIYCGFLWVLFYKLKLVRPSKVSWSVATGVGVTLIAGILLILQISTPYSKQLVVFERVVQIVPRVTGRVIEVPVAGDQRVEKGDVLFRIDPQPFQAAVDRLQAELAAAKQNVPILKASYEQAKANLAGAKSRREFTKYNVERLAALDRTRSAADFELVQSRDAHAAAEAAVQSAVAKAEQARLTYESEINGVNTTVAHVQAQLDEAQIDLIECTVYAPTNGYVTNLQLKPGFVASVSTMSPVMTFVDESESLVMATFAQNLLRYIRSGAPVEIALDMYPGKILTGEVDAVIWITGEGQFSPSGMMVQAKTIDPNGRFFVRLKLDDASLKYRLPAGAGGVAAVYTATAKPVHIIRKIIIRMTSWLNYL